MHLCFAALAAPAYTLPPALLAKSLTLQHIQTGLYFGGTAWALFWLGLLLRWRAGARIAAWAGAAVRRRGRGPFAERPFLAGLLVAPAWLLILAAIAMPGLLVAQAASLRFGLSIERWPAWWLDWIKGEAIELVLGTLVLSLVFLLLRRSPRLWWLWCWAILQPFVILGVFLAPMVLDPIFNHFTPLQARDPALVVRLEQVAALGGLHIPPSRMFVEDASRRTTGINAYVTGIGDSKRIVVWDTTLAKVPTDEILAIYAHEQGHYVLHHIWKGIAFSAGLTLAVFALLAWIYGGLVPWGTLRWHIEGPSDWAALPLLLLLATLLGFLAAPAANGFSRWEEHAADVYGQRLLSRILPNAAQVEVEDFNRLGRVWLEYPYPNPFVVWWTYSHPPTSVRAEDARRMGRHS